MDMETPLKRREVVGRDLPIDLIEKIYTYLPKDGILSGKCVSRELKKVLSSYQFSSSVTNNNPLSSPKILVFKDNAFSILGVDHPSTSAVVYTKAATAPSLISDMLEKEGEEDDDDDICIRMHDHDVQFHGSTGGLVCLTIDRSGYIVWNPSTGTCREFPKLSSTSSALICGMGDAGDGEIQIACVGTAAKTMPNVGVPMVIHLLSVSTCQWVTVDIDAVFMGTYPSYVGVAGDMLMWAYPFINPHTLSAYNFRTRSVMTIDKPHLLPPHLELAQQPLPNDDEKELYRFRLYVGANVFWALGEDTEQGTNYFRTYVAGRWEHALDAFEIPAHYGMVDTLVGSSSDFTRLLLLSNEDHLLLFHSVLQGGEFPISLVDSPVLNAVNIPDSASQTTEFTDLRFIQFENTLFFPDVPGARNVQTESLKKEEGVHELTGAGKDELAAAVPKHSEGSGGSTSASAV